MKNKILSLLLSITMIITAMPVGIAYAEDGSGELSASDFGMVIKKTATPVEGKDDEFTITLDAYSTGSKVNVTVDSQTPTDIVLVLDQSGSMTKNKFPTTTYTYNPITGNNKQSKNLYDVRANGGSNNLWYENDGKYYSVSVTRENGVRDIAPFSNYRNNNSDRVYNNGPRYTNLWDNRNNLYVKLTDGTVQKVTVSRTNNNGYYTYTLPDGTVIANRVRYNTGVPSFTSNVEGIGTATESFANGTFKYYYTEPDNASQPILIESVVGENTVPTTTFYTRTGFTDNTKTRLDALKTAVTQFVNSVGEKAQTYNVDHRVAMVGFASGHGYYNWMGLYSTENYENSELFVGSNVYTYNAGRNDNAANSNSAQSHYAQAFQNMNTAPGRSNISASIGKLEGSGGTVANLGLEMATGIFANDPYKNDQVKSKEDRNKVVVFFTDGTPGWTGWDSDIANSTITLAKALKDQGITVYTVGILTEITKIDDMENDTNKYMHGVSSNYPNATKVTALGDRANTGSTGYYLLASNGDELDSIFDSIAKNIQDDLNTREIGSTTVIKDLVSPQFTLPDGAEVGQISVKRVPFDGFYDNEIGFTDEDNCKWKNEQHDAEGIEVTVVDGKDSTGPENNGSVSVKGYDFTQNWCGLDSQTVSGQTTNTPHGSKLVISFNVKVRENFLGGNSVKTNAGATIEIHDKDGNTIGTVPFDEPEVNVPISPVTVNAEEKNIYLLGDVDQEEMIDGATVKVGNVVLDLTSPYDEETGEIYGLDPWQTAYTDIFVEYKDKNGTVIYREKNGVKYEKAGEHFDDKPAISDLTDDSKFTIDVTVDSKVKSNDADDTLPGTVATVKTGKKDANVNVFKPVMTFKDSHVYLGGEVFGSYDHDKNFVSVDWVHKDASGAVDMTAGTGEGKTAVLGSAPTLTETYETKTGIISDDTDIDVNVTEVTIDKAVVTEHVTFAHQACLNNPKLDNPECATIDEHKGDATETVDDIETSVPEFKLHVYTPTLTFKDTTAYYGDAAPEMNDATFLDSTADVTWAHGNTAAPTTMNNAEPTLTTTYTAEDGKIVNNLIETRDDIKVDATVKVGDTDITSYVRFNHTDCTNPADHIDSHKDDATKNEAWIHVKTCDLTVSKNVSGNKYDAGDSFIITVTDLNGFSQKIVLNGGDNQKLTGLKVGTYTVTEDTGWSWRYTATGNNAQIILNKTAPSGTATITNKVENNKWISASSIVENLFQNKAVTKK